MTWHAPSCSGGGIFNARSWQWQPRLLQPVGGACSMLLASPCFFENCHGSDLDRMMTNPVHSTSRCLSKDAANKVGHTAGRMHLSGPAASKMNSLAIGQRPVQHEAKIKYLWTHCHVYSHACVCFRRSLVSRAHKGHDKSPDVRCKRRA